MRVVKGYIVWMEELIRLEVNFWVFRLEFFLLSYVVFRREVRYSFVMGKVIWYVFFLEIFGFRRYKVI